LARISATNSPITGTKPIAAELIEFECVSALKVFFYIIILVLLKNDPFETGHGAEFASRERLVHRNSSHQGELMYLPVRMMRPAPKAFGAGELPSESRIEPSFD
jgi:hypothetical protein